MKPTLLAAALCLVAGAPGALRAQTCQAKELGDGACDPACNTASFQYDGGDCCPATCQDGRPSACGAQGYQCRAQTKPRTCLFLHGLGRASRGPGPFGPTPPLRDDAERGTVSYWGDLPTLLSGPCAQVEFSNLDTLDLDWNDPRAQALYYDKAKEVSAKGGVVFAHSMGNLLLAGACQSQKLCSVKWYSLGGPLRGSTAAAVGPALTTGWVNRALAPERFTGDGKLQTPGQVVRERGLLLGAVCGANAWGSGGVTGRALRRLQDRVQGRFEPVTDERGRLIDRLPVAGDGLLSWDECALADEPGEAGQERLGEVGPFDVTPRAAFYRAQANHWDLTGSGGDVDSVIAWMRNMARR